MPIGRTDGEKELKFTNAAKRIKWKMEMNTHKIEWKYYALVRLVFAIYSPFRLLTHSDRLYNNIGAAAAAAAAASIRFIYLYFHSPFFRYLHSLFHHFAQFIQATQTGGRGINKWFPCNKNAKEENKIAIFSLRALALFLSCFALGTCWMLDMKWIPIYKCASSVPLSVHVSICLRIQNIIELNPNAAR